MKAIIFAAGLGTRLKPHTDQLPKALVKIGDQTLLEYQIKKLLSAGFDEIIVNVYHFAEQIIKFLGNKDFGVDIHISDESEFLLDTGGALMKARHFLEDEEPFLALNVDIISDLDLNELYLAHLRKKVLATLAVKQRETSRYLLFNKDLLLCGWKNIKTNESIIAREESMLTSWAFSGIHVIDPILFSKVELCGKFSIIPVYLELAKNYNIRAFPHNEVFWMDVGKPPELEKARQLMK